MAKVVFAKHSPGQILFLCSAPMKQSEPGNYRGPLRIGGSEHVHRSSMNIEVSGFPNPGPTQRWWPPVRRVVFAKHG